jgi:hypothetical protein
LDEILRGSPKMTRYVARFMKNVLGENGHEAEICQRSMEIEALSQEAAAELAKIRFCEGERLKDWSLHADRLQVSEATFPS